MSIADEVRSTHTQTPVTSYCVTCDQQFPCDAVLVLRDAERMAAALDRVASELLTPETVALLAAYR